MNEPLPSAQYHVTTDEPPTPAYSDLIHFAAVGRALTIWAGYALSQRPSAAIVRRALCRQGLLTEAESTHHEP